MAGSAVLLAAEASALKPIVNMQARLWTIFKTEMVDRTLGFEAEDVLTIIPKLALIGIDLGTVDSYQERECKSVVMFSIVTSEPRGGLIGVPQRPCVAQTRHMQARLDVGEPAMENARRFLEGFETSHEWCISHPLGAQKYHTAGASNRPR
ncbi:hypothetical protein GQ53DRAFT_773568 [Thozetella sp. PMI_491]|nr:hypothetical protein GQ53DRAFT_773568 [Thozetella sp. PMI_491]